MDPRLHCECSNFLWKRKLNLWLEVCWVYSSPSPPRKHISFSPLGITCLGCAKGQPRQHGPFRNGGRMRWGWACKEKPSGQGSQKTLDKELFLFQHVPEAFLNSKVLSCWAIMGAGVVAFEGNSRAIIYKDNSLPISETRTCWCNRRGNLCVCSN